MAERASDHEKLKNLFDEARNGSLTAQDEIYKYFYSPLYRYFFMRTQNDDEAVDLTQTSFVKFYGNLAKITQTISLPSFIFTIARNTLIDYWRKRGTRNTVVSDEVVMIESENQAEDKKEIGLQFTDMIERLSEEQKEALTLRYVEDLPAKDIAEIMGKSEEAIRQLLSRGIKALRENIKEYE